MVMEELVGLMEMMIWIFNSHMFYVYIQTMCDFTYFRTTCLY